MPKLDASQTQALMRLLVRSTNKIKGRSLDQARMAFSSDRQYEEFRKELKDYESGLRKVLMGALVDAGITDSPLSNEDLMRLK